MSDQFYEEICDEPSSRGREKKLESAKLDSVSQFIGDISRYSLLNAEEEIALGKRIAKGDMKARNELCDANYRLVVKIAKMYTFSGLDLEDLIQAGCEGLIKAAEKYNYKLGYRFSTYATQWIRQAISRSVADTGRTIRVPVHMQEAISKQNKAVAHLIQELGRDPNVEEIAAETGETVDRVLAISAVTPDASSLDAPINEEENSDLYAVVSDNVNDMPEEYVVNESLGRELNKALSVLTRREAEVLRLRNGLDGEDICTLEELAKRYGVTRERVRQIEATAMHKLRHSDAARSLRDYLAA